MSKYTLFPSVGSIVFLSTIAAPLAAMNLLMVTLAPTHAQQISRGNGYILMQLPNTGNQNDHWSSGSNSAARILSFYGHDVNYDTVRSATRQEFILPNTMNVQSPTWRNPTRTRRVDVQTGATPYALRDVIGRWEQNNVQLQNGADFSRLLGLLGEGKPVIALLRMANAQVTPQDMLGNLLRGNSTWPVMNWVAVQGFDQNKSLVFYTDANGRQYQVSYDEFQRQWDWRVDGGFMDEEFRKNDVQPKTMLWVNRVLDGTMGSNPYPGHPNPAYNPYPVYNPNQQPQYNPNPQSVYNPYPVYNPNQQPQYNPNPQSVYNPQPNVRVSANNAQTVSSDLIWYRNNGWQDGSFRWASSNGLKVGSGWNFKTIFSSSNGTLYGIDANNNLFWYRHDGWQNGAFNWADNNGVKIGSGWNFKQVFAGANGTIYSINDNNELMWHRHAGWQDGSDRWVNTAGMKVGSNWDFETVFVGGNGVIYGLKSNGDLYWFRHGGWQNGANQWANGGNGVKIGSGWDFKTAFSDSKGLIYGIKPNGDLYLYRHIGWQDGSNRWGNNPNGVKIGSGWNFRSAFSGSDGTIYGILP